MSRVKSGFVKAGSIIAIVLAGLMAIGGVMFFTSQTVLTHEYYIQDILGYPREKYDDITNADGSITYKLHQDDGEILIVEGEKVDAQINLLKKVMTSVGVYLEIAAVASLVLSILLLISDSKGKASSGLVIGLLTTGILTGNILTAAFMIVALCLKDKQEEKPAEVAAA